MSKESKAKESAMDPVVEDMSITLLAGRVPSASPALSQAEEAERFGFKRVWIPERYTNKEAGVLLSAIAARTSRLGIGTGPLTINARPPIVTAALGATLSSLFGSRFTLGVGRGPKQWDPGYGFSMADYPTLIDLADIIKRLWRGETIQRDGPAGNYRGLRLADPLDGPVPDIIFFHLGGPQASKVAANPVFDSVGLCNITTADAMRRSIEMTKQECARIGRDPSTLKFIAPVTTACELSETETLIMVAVRIAVYLQLPLLGDALVKLNRWDERVVNEIRNHPLFQNQGVSTAVQSPRREETTGADQNFRREDPRLIEVSRLVPESWLCACAAIGSADECVKALQRYRDAGADEIDIYSSTPAQNATLIRAWRQRPEAKKALSGVSK